MAFRSADDDIGGLNAYGIFSSLNFLFMTLENAKRFPRSINDQYQTPTPFEQRRQEPLTCAYLVGAAPLNACCFGRSTPKCLNISTRQL